MHLRPAQPDDLEQLIEIDGTIESTRYLHLERAGEGLTIAWNLQERPLREKLIDSNPVNEDQHFTLRQILTGADEGIILVAEHEGQLVALALAQADPATNVLSILDLRVDFDHRREGLGSALLFHLISIARQSALRALRARTTTSNLPAAQFLLKAGFDLCGVDTHFSSNADVVKESASLFWYATLE